MVWCIGKHGARWARDVEDGKDKVQKIGRRFLDQSKDFYESRELFNHHKNVHLLSSSTLWSLWRFVCPGHCSLRKVKSVATRLHDFIDLQQSPVTPKWLLSPFSNYLAMWACMNDEKMFSLCCLSCNWPHSLNSSPTDLHFVSTLQLLCKCCFLLNEGCSNFVSVTK